MSLHITKNRISSPLMQNLKDYREKYALTQEQLANDLAIDVRTLRRWESGDTILNDVRELRRIATFLGIEPERLGIANTTHIPLASEQIDEAIAHIWNLIDQARNYEADILIERLLQDLTLQITNEDPLFLTQLAQAFHLAGYMKSVITRAYEATSALHHYHEMEKVARVLQNDTLLNIALTYEGDMYCRLGEIEKGIVYLEAARDTTSKADLAARGNGIQLLGRAYLRAHRQQEFEYAMGEAETLSLAIRPEESSTRGQYSLGTVYEEYGRSYAQLGQTQRALDYLDKAELHLAQTKHWEILLKTARAGALIHGGELQSGVTIAVDAIRLCREHGALRLMERMYGIQKYLDRLTRDIGRAGTQLREALDGPIEYE